MKPIKAEWRDGDGFYNPMAGRTRNGKMLDLKPKLIVCFPGGKGTANLWANAVARKVKVIRVD